MRLTTAAVIALLAAPASAATVPERFEIHEGVYQFVSADGYASFGPSLGFDVVYGSGKGAKLRRDWPAHDVPRITKAHHSGEFARPSFPLPRLPYLRCDCEVPVSLVALPQAVSLPAAGWLLMAGLGALVGFRRYITR